MKRVPVENLKAGDLLVSEFTGEPKALVAAVREVRGLFEITFADGRTFPKVNGSFMLTIR